MAAAYAGPAWPQLVLHVARAGDAVGGPQRARGLGWALGGPTQHDVAAGDALDRDRVVVDAGVHGERGSQLGVRRRPEAVAVEGLGGAGERLGHCAQRARRLR